MSATDLDDSFNRRRAPAPPRITLDAVIAALTFSTPREVNTANGPRMVSDAQADQTVRDFWRDQQADMRAAGYSVGEWPKASGRWKITRWEKLPEKIVVKREEARALSRATDAEINVPAPDGLAYLGYQRAGIAFGFERSAVLIADEMGLGKTIQAIGILNACPELRRVLVICPASLKLNWKRELEKWLVRPRTVFVADSKLFPDLADGIVVVNYDVLHKHEDALRDTDWDALIVDEAHYLKNAKARRSKMVLGVKCSKKEKDKGMADVPGIGARKRIFLTGTPIANRPAELFPLISYLDPATWNNFFRYGLRYCAGNDWSGHWDFSGASHLDELQDRLRSSIMIRRLKKDVLTELPPKRRQVIEFPAGPGMEHVIRAERQVFEAVDDLEAQVELAAASDNPGAYQAAVDQLNKGMKAAFEGLATLRLETARVKIPVVVDHLKDAVEESGKVVCFVHHKEMARAVLEAFGPAAVMLVGDTPMEERQAAVDRFQTDDTCKLFIGSIMAAGVGITLTAASHVVFCELDWVPGNVSQAEDRCHRIGQAESVLVQHLVLEGSIDATMARRIIKKQEVIEKALDVVAPKRPDRAPSDRANPGRPADARDLLAAEAEAMTQDQREAAQTAIQFIAGRCNGARDWDGVGFSKIDTRIGKELAAQPRLSPKQAALARKIVWKYRGQLPDTLAERLK